MQYEYKTEPYQHQRDAFNASADKVNYAYFMEMGCGKSKVLIDNTAYLYEQGRINTLIVVAPKGVYRNWVLKEVPTHMPDRIPHEMFTWRSQANKTQRKELYAGLAYQEGLRILIVNVEAFTSAKCVEYVRQFMKGQTVMLAVDESTIIKNPKAKRTKVLSQLAQDADYRRILTGSPVTQSPMDLYAQCAFLNKGLLGYDNFYTFQARYAIIKRQTMGAHSFNQVVGYRNLPELADKVAGFSSRVLKKDCLDLPEKTYTTRVVSMTPEQTTHYMAMKKTAMLVLDDDLVIAQQAMTQLLRLQQILCGYIPTDDGIKEIPTRRLDAMAEVVAEMSGKVIIWARFRRDIEQIVERLQKDYGPNSVGAYYGDTSDQDREALVVNFQDPDHETRFFVGNPQTAGYGLTLTAAHNVVYFSNDFNLETRVQSEDRCHRIGQTKNVTYVDLITEGTVDEHIVRTLQNKIKLAGAALGEEMRQWLNIQKR